MGIAEHKAFVSHLEANGSISITLPSRAGSSDRGLSAYISIMEVCAGNSCI